MGAGMILGFVAVVPFFKHETVKAEALLNPPPQIYDKSLPKIFSGIREVLSESAYPMGDRWRIVKADTQTGHIIAELRFANDAIDFKDRRSIVRRYVEADFKLRPDANGTILQSAYKVELEGFQYWACDRIIRATQAAINKKSLAISSH
ncbi:unnamed protein product [Sphagnum balticum]